MLDSDARTFNNAIIFKEKLWVIERFPACLHLVSMSWNIKRMFALQLG